jgi:hypothetical protein
MNCGNVLESTPGPEAKSGPIKISRRQTNLTKAARFVIRTLSHDQLPIAGTIANAVRRYKVSRHDLWMHIQLAGN